MATEGTYVYYDHSEARNSASSSWRPACRVLSLSVRTWASWAVGCAIARPWRPGYLRRGGSKGGGGCPLRPEHYRDRALASADLPAAPVTSVVSRRRCAQRLGLRAGIGRRVQRIASSPVRSRSPAQYGYRQCGTQRSATSRACTAVAKGSLKRRRLLGGRGGRCARRTYRARARISTRKLVRAAVRIPTARRSLLRTCPPATSLFSPLRSSWYNATV